MEQFNIENKYFSNFGLRELRALEEKLRKVYSERLEFSSLFLFPVDINNLDSMKLSEAICEDISTKLHTHSTGINLMDMHWGEVNFNNIQLQHLFFENAAPLLVKNTLLNTFRRFSGGDYNSRLNKYGLFIPRTGKVSCYTFIHSGGYYRFRRAVFKLNSIHPDLKNYLESIPYSCPNQYFLNGPRASGLNLKLEVSLINVHEHEIIEITAGALKERILKSAHEDVEKYFLETDPRAIATEVPVWLEPEEMKRYRFPTTHLRETLTGHIDLVRQESNGMIGIWDYKPRAKYERKAHVQVYLYALMLAQRTGIPLNNFLCGYFDAETAFYFKAGDVLWGDARTE